MLILTRRIGETIQIGDGITVVLLHVGQGRIRLGINAPNEVPILRGELVETPSAKEAA
jgi:carbon storage regulator